MRGSKIRFEFRGKSGKSFSLDLNDRRLAKIVNHCQDLPGQELFQYVDEEGQHRTINSSDVNDYLREVTREDFTAKDFRTWAGTVLAARALREIKQFDSKAHAKRNIANAIDTVAKKLGNTRSVCRNCYIHLAVINSYLDGSLLNPLSEKADPGRLSCSVTKSRRISGDGDSPAIEGRSEKKGRLDDEMMFAAAFALILTLDHDYFRRSCHSRSCTLRVL